MDLIFPQPEAGDYDEDGRLLASYLEKLDPVESFTGREVAAEENRIRAGWTVRPLESFIDETYSGDADGEPLDQVVSDLICNLLHLCDAARLGADATLQKALRAYGEETTEVRNGVCECGEIVSPQPTVGDGDEIFAAQRRWAAQLIEIGFEGGIGYWARAMGTSSGSLDNGIDRIILVEWEAALAALEGGPWIDEAFDGQDPRIAKFTHTLTASATVNAIEKIIAVLAPESHPENWTNDLKRLWSSDPDELTDSIGNVDADLADLVIQYAIFGEVKYGCCRTV